MQILPSNKRGLKNEKKFGKNNDDIGESFESGISVHPSLRNILVDNPLPSTGRSDRAQNG